MFSSIVIIVVLSIAALFFIFQKRDMLLKFFSVDVTSSTHHFQEQLEQTADIVIKRLEEQINHLEYLLEEANTKIINLDNKIQDADNFIKKENTIHHEKSVSTQHFQQQTEQINHLEYLLAEANTKIINLDNKIQNTNLSVEKEKNHIQHLEPLNHLENISVEADSEITSVDNEIQSSNNFLEKEDTTECVADRETVSMPAEQIMEEYNIATPNINPINNIAIATDRIANLSIEDYKSMARNDKRGSIIAMTELGYDMNQIAKTTGISKGEIMLLLQLNKRV